MNIMEIEVLVPVADAVRNGCRHGVQPAPVRLDELTNEQREMLAHLVAEIKGRAYLREASDLGFAGKLTTHSSHAPLPGHTHEAVAEYLDECLARQNQSLAEREKQIEQQKEKEKAAQEERRRRAEEQAALPLADQLLRDYERWVVVYPLAEYPDLCGEAEQECARRKEQEALARDERKRAEQENKEREQQLRDATLRGVVERHLPDVLTEWDAGELAPKEPVDVVLRHIREAVTTFGSQVPDHDSNAHYTSEADKLTRAAILARNNLRAETDRVRQAICDSLETVPMEAVRMDEGPLKWRTLYRKATEADYDDEDSRSLIDNDGDVKIGTYLMITYTVDVGGIVLQVDRVLEERPAAE